MDQRTSIIKEQIYLRLISVEIKQRKRKLEVGKKLHMIWWKKTVRRNYKRIQVAKKTVQRIRRRKGMFPRKRKKHDVSMIVSEIRGLEEKNSDIEEDDFYVSF
ncbi:hypothetical protein Tco_0578704 [Tanacetum coccineum]